MPTTDLKRPRRDLLPVLRMTSQFPSPHSHLMEWAVKEIARLRERLTKCRCHEDSR